MGKVIDFEKASRRFRSLPERHYPEKGVTIPAFDEIEVEGIRNEVSWLIDEMLKKGKKRVLESRHIRGYDISMSLFYDDYEIFLDLRMASGIGQKFRYETSGKFIESSYYFSRPQK